MEISLNAACLLLSIMIISSEDAMSSVTMTQSNSEVIIGGTTRMLCVTSLPNEVHWRHLPAGGPAHEPKEVYTFGKMRSPYKDRFEMQINRTMGVYQLVIPRVELTDAGIYTCQEDEGIGNFSQAQLTVLETGPTCSSTKSPIQLIGPNSCNKEQEDLTLSCSVVYRGNNLLLEWKMAGANDTVTQGVTVERLDNRITSHLTMPSQPSIDGSRFICHTTETKYNCTSDVINIIYAISSDFTQKALIGDTVVCTANSNESCSYRWKWFKGDDVLTASNSRTLIPEKSGNFRCEADCIIRNESCTITAGFAYVEDGNATSTTGETSGTWLIAVVVVTSIIIAVAIISIIVFVLRARNKNLAEKTQHIDNTRENVPLQNSSTINSNPTTPLHSRMSVNSQDEVESAVYPECIIKTAFKADAYICKGLNGDIYGPGKYEDKTYACEKILFSTNQLTSANDGEVTKKENILRNGQQWKTLNHDNLLKFYDIVEQSTAVYVVMEYAQGGFVRSALNTYKEDLPMPVVKDWATQIATGMEYLHKNDIVHNNLKCARVLIMEPPTTAQATLKIASFNLNDEVNTTTPMTFKGMFAWMAPEAISENVHSIHSDIWSYGVAVWEILTRGIPYKGYTSGDIINGICSGELSLEIPESCPKILRDIFQECFQLKPSRRPTFSKILRQFREAD